jgi:hypothetical protein
VIECASVVNLALLEGVEDKALEDFDSEAVAGEGERSLRGLVLLESQGRKMQDRVEVLKVKLVLHERLCFERLLPLLSSCKQIQLETMETVGAEGPWRHW